MAQAVIFGCAGLSLSSDEAAFFRESDPWGFILFARNLGTASQIRALCSDLRAAVGRDRAPIFIDQEGGRVARLRGPRWREWVPALEEDPDAIYLRYQVIGAELRQLGITGNCAPVLDIAQDDTHPVLKNRCLSTDAAQVAERGRAVADGLSSVGVLPVIKHMPGQGRANLDSHVDLPRVLTSAKDLNDHEFAPFRALADLPLGMTSHIVFDAVDDAPTTFSKPVIDLIRNSIGFDGLLMTDDLSMGALTGSFQDRVRRAYGAGCDIILHCNSVASEMAAIATETRAMEVRRSARVDAALSCGKPQDVVDIDDVYAQYSSIKMTE